MAMSGQCSETAKILLHFYIATLETDVRLAKLVRIGEGKQPGIQKMLVLEVGCAWPKGADIATKQCNITAQRKPGCRHNVLFTVR
jgi:hypothetical protein